MKDTQPDPKLVGVYFKRGVAVDDILSEVATRLKTRDVAVSGLVQVPGDPAGDCDCRQMRLRDLATGVAHAITENRGSLAVGCHLDRHALAGLAHGLEASLGPDTGVLILNRFGQAESEGRGFRGAIEAAMALGIPVIIAYRDEFEQEWVKFEGGLATNLPADADMIIAGLDLVND
jgi:uncharacterized protein DUF2478